VGSGPVDLPGVPVGVVAWREDTEVDEIRGCLQVTAAQVVEVVRGAMSAG
jgi:hypothetical protein